MADCIFCKIANGEIPAATLYEDEDFRVILDLGPASKGHSLILPKKHAANISNNMYYLIAHFIITDEFTGSFHTNQTTIFQTFKRLFPQILLNNHTLRYPKEKCWQEITKYRPNIVSNRHFMFFLDLSFFIACANKDKC